MDDRFIQAYIGELQCSLCTSYLIDLIQPHTRLELAFLAKQLNVEISEVDFSTPHPSSIHPTVLYFPRARGEIGAPGKDGNG
ncbi:hypothetical protein DFH08DRAFT_976820 [Mycena albidolilacea]|uniref:Uncharacterized protein n=1 Tax=Mycena albidolilacea TaxID=1033008 RepID=A0AAD6Z2N0_9AGAR|nr:hypothetical protein DFH08DRAFT_976820 [Mycena albidolilacea]